ncbi:MAG: hypothetical protein EBY38_03810 [Flavobacteriaceae bacterium]|nr:hypothetical protein [Flavobacteriaceae bacterium]
MPRLLTWVLVFFILVGVIDEASAQCAMCRAVLESEASGQAAKGINNGIVYLMIFPYLLVGAVGYAVYKLRRSKG